MLLKLLGVIYHLRYGDVRYLTNGRTRFKTQVNVGFLLKSPTVFKFLLEYYQHSVRYLFIRLASLTVLAVDNFKHFFNSTSICPPSTVSC